jgi:hypothetical protein
MQKKNRKSIKNKKYKGGNINKDSNYLTIITPCIKQENLDTIKNSIDFTKNLLWIIIYDTTNKKFEHKYNDVPKIVEYDYSDTTGTSGNPQRNFGLDKVKNGFIYFLDDDNLVHPDLYTIINTLEDNKIYTFNQDRPEDIFPFTNNLKGNKIELCKIDSAMFLIDFKLCKDVRWNPYKYFSDGIYISEIYSQHKNKWVYIDQTLSYYNKV